MVYFIPNWRPYTLQLGYNIIISQLAIFQDNNEDCTLITNSFLPMLTYQLNEFGLLNTPYWQALDEIQDVHIKIGKPLAIEDLPLSSDLERVYSPRGVQFLKDDQLYAKANYFAGKVLSTIEYYQDNQLTAIDYFDSRGFLSRRGTYDNGVPYQTQLYNPLSEVVLTINHTQNDQVQIAEPFQKRFAHSHYSKLTDLISEVSQNHFNQVKTDPEIKIINNPTEDSLALTHELQRKCQVCSFLTDANLIKRPFLAQLSAKNSAILVPNQLFAAKIKRIWHEKAHPLNVKIVSPYAAHLNLGISNSMEQQVIFWKVNQMPERTIRRLTQKLLQVVIEGKNKALAFVANHEAIHEVLKQEVITGIENHFDVSLSSTDFKWVHKYLRLKKGHQLTPKLRKRAKEKEQQTNWDQLVDASETLDRIKIYSNNEPSFYQQSIHEARVLVDLDRLPSPYLQVSAISAGIPQINVVKTNYVDYDKNGIIIKNDLHLIKAVNYFLDHLDHWNQSLVADISKIEMFSSEKIVTEINSIFKEMRRN
ncbi:accessory Sec system protein Asp1 [Fructilactobacillus fructivorans]|uniref:accessory Sec system protein Asp1 n=1 Tax=Fructilactobacillus fructivorans TaxID=1614 RepID=UPI00070BF55C|nr:accessory Sec system protein Asp1 [Fructilactobacillus fructivorans]KRN41261.1 accessory secretory protein Asp1 [Fructilactobacillus fructivorans]